VALTRDVFKIKEREIKDKHYEKHQELTRKIEETPEYQKLAKEMDGLDKQKEKLEEKIDKLKRNIGKDYWEFEKKVLERLNEEFIKVRIAVMNKDIEEVKSIIEEFAKKEFWEG
jgi:molecular chaperone GrpE (heat shock protein)